MTQIHLITYLKAKNQTLPMKSDNLKGQVSWRHQLLALQAFVLQSWPLANHQVNHISTYSLQPSEQDPIHGIKYCMNFIEIGPYQPLISFPVKDDKSLGKNGMKFTTGSNTAQQLIRLFVFPVIHLEARRAKQTRFKWLDLATEKSYRKIQRAPEKCRTHFLNVKAERTWTVT